MKILHTRFSPRVAFSGFLLVLLTASVGIGAYYANQQSGFELRKKAAEVQGPQILFKGPQKVNVGEKFTVNLILDTTTDSRYTISGVDAVVSYSSQNIEGSGQTTIPLAGTAVIKPETNPIGVSEEENRRRAPVFSYNISLLSVTPGKIFDSYPTQGPSVGEGGGILPKTPPAPPVKLCGGIVGETCPGDYECVYGDGSTRVPYPDAQGVCYEAGKRSPSPLGQITISGIKNYSVSDKGYFNGFTGQGVFAILTFVATQPGKVTVSLAYNGPSATDDTNINGFLANQPVSLQKPQERLLTAPQAFTVEVVALQITPTPTPKLSQTPTPKPTCTPLPPCAYEGEPDQNDPNKRVFCAVDLLPGAWSCPRLTPTPTPQPVGKLSFTLFDASGAPVRQTVKIFAGPANQNVKGATVYAAGFFDLLVSDTPSPQTPPPPTSPGRDGLILLGETQTNASGVGDLSIKNEYLNKPWALYAQTPSHLIRYMQVNIFPIWFSPGKTVDVKFDKLIAGDIYVAENQNRQDGVVNNFDVADLFRQWGPYAQIQIYPPKPPVPADLNADGTVNNRDLAILLSNFGKKGDLQSGISIGEEGNFAGVLKPLDPNRASIYQWGTHTLTLKEGKTFLVNGAKELLTRYEGVQVVVSGTLEYLQLEGGFWGLTAKGVVVDK